MQVVTQPRNTPPRSRYRTAGSSNIDAVVVTFNSESEIAALAESNWLWTNFDRVIVVDNHSTDRTCAVAAAAGMTVIEQPRNIGFGSAANVGAALTRGANFALLNPDIRFTSPTGAYILAQQLNDPRVALVGPRLVLPNGASQDSAREVPSPLNLIRRRLTHKEHGRLATDMASDAPWVVGGCVVIRRAAFEAVGGFDPRYFLYFEDVDLCVRLWEGGWAVRFEPTVSVRHEHRAASRGPFWSRATRRHIRSAARFYIRHPRYLAPQPDAVPRHAATHRPARVFR